MESNKADLLFYELIPVNFYLKGVVALAKDGDSFIKFQHAEKVVNNGGSGAIYGLGIIGAFIYFMQRADGFWAVVWGIIQAIFWPAVIMYEVLKRLNI